MAISTTYWKKQETVHPRYGILFERSKDLESSLLISSVMMRRQSGMFWRRQLTIAVSTLPKKSALGQILKPYMPSWITTLFKWASSQGAFPRWDCQNIRRILNTRSKPVSKKLVHWRMLWERYSRVASKVWIRYRKAYWQTRPKALLSDRCSIITRCCEFWHSSNIIIGLYFGDVSFAAVTK